MLSITLGLIHEHKLIVQFVGITNYQLINTISTTRGLFDNHYFEASLIF